MNVYEDSRLLVEKKLAKFDRFFGEDAEAFVCFMCIRDLKRMEITISAGGTLFRAEEETDTFNTALDRCIESIERQIRKNKTRLARKLRENAFEPSLYDDAEDIEEEGEFRIRVKTFQYKPMSTEEAILQMNLLGHQFFVFDQADGSGVCVVYKRKDGEYGLIAPSH